MYHPVPEGFKGVADETVLRSLLGAPPGVKVHGELLISLGDRLFRAQGWVGEPSPAATQESSSVIPRHKIIIIYIYIYYVMKKNMCETNHHAVHHHHLIRCD